MTLEQERAVALASARLRLEGEVIRGVPDVLKGAAHGAVRGAFSLSDLITLPFQLPGPDVKAIRARGGILPMSQAALATARPEQLEMLRKAPTTPPLLQAPSSVIAKALGTTPATTGPGKMVEEAVAGGVGMLGFPGAMGPKIAAGVGGGLGGETAANLFGESPYARAAGTLIGGPTGYAALEGGKFSRSFMGGPSVSTPRMVSESAKGMTPEDWVKATLLAREAKAKGVDLTAIQAIEKPTSLLGLQESVTRSAAGGPTMTEFLSKQTGQAAGAGRGMLGEIAPPIAPAKAAYGAQKAATGAVEAEKKFRTEVATPYFETTPDVKQTGILQMNLPVLAARIRVSGANEATEAGRAIGELADSVRKVSSVEQLNTLYNEWNQGLTAKLLNNKPITDYTAGRIREGGLKVLDEFLGGYQRARKAGQEAYKAISGGLVTPERRSPIGQIAGQKGVIEDVPTATKRILSVLDNPETIRAQSILRTQKVLHAQDPKAFPSLVRAMFEQKLEKAFTPKEGFTVAEAPANLAKTLWGGPDQIAMRENFRALMAGVARSNGMERYEGAIVKGAENLMRVMEAAGRGKAGIGTTASGGGSSMVENILFRGGPGASTTLQLRTFSRIDDMLHGKAYKEIAELLTSPEGMKELQRLAAFDLRQHRLGGISGTVAAGVVQREKE